MSDAAGDRDAITEAAIQYTTEYGRLGQARSELHYATVRRDLLLEEYNQALEKAADARIHLLDTIRKAAT